MNTTQLSFHSKLYAKSKGIAWETKNPIKEIFYVTAWLMALSKMPHILLHNKDTLISSHKQKEFQGQASLSFDQDLDG